MLEHAVPMDAGFMGKGIRAGNGLVVGNGLADNNRKQAAGRINLLCLDACLESVIILAHFRCHGHFLEGGICPPFRLCR